MDDPQPPNILPSSPSLNTVALKRLLGDDEDDPTLAADQGRAAKVARLDESETPDQQAGGPSSSEPQSELEASVALQPVDEVSPASTGGSVLETAAEDDKAQAEAGDQPSEEIATDAVSVEESTPVEDALAASATSDSIEGVAPGGASEMAEVVWTPDKLQVLCDALEAELSCPLCAATFYKPVSLSPCGHCFCGSCLSLYLLSAVPAPHSCPSCRSNATSATFSRPLSNLVNTLVSTDPTKARAQAEKDQSDDAWQVGEPLKFSSAPLPPAPPRPAELYRPCRYCHPGYEWQCPVPVPAAGSLEVYPLDGPCPPGHYQCAGCSRLSATGAPLSSSCGICEESYCGSGGVHGGCNLPSLAASQPGETWGRSALSLADCIYEPQYDELANAFKDNSLEMSIFGDYVSTHPLVTPAVVYSEIIAWLASPAGQSSGGVRGLFHRTDPAIHSNLVEGGPAIERICGSCSNNLFSCGLFEYWLRRRPAVLGELPKEVARKPDCVRGRSCYRSGSSAHSRKYNHICEPSSQETIAASQQNDDPLPPLPASPILQSVELPEQVAAPLESASADMEGVEGAVERASAEAGLGGGGSQHVVQSPEARVFIAEESDSDGEDIAHRGTSTNDLADWLSSFDTPPFVPEPARSSASTTVDTTPPLPAIPSAPNASEDSCALAAGPSTMVAAASSSSDPGPSSSISQDIKNGPDSTWTVTSMEVDQDAELDEPSMHGPTSSVCLRADAPFSYAA